MKADIEAILGPPEPPGALDWVTEKLKIAEELKFRYAKALIKLIRLETVTESDVIAAANMFSIEAERLATATDYYQSKVRMKA